MKKEDNFCDTIFAYRRRTTIPVVVADKIIGGNAGILVQSMCTTDTLDVSASVAQALRIVAAGGEMVRFTVQTVNHARELGNIRSELRRLGCRVPLVADVHFNSEVALQAAACVDKVRINPGNFVDKRADLSAVNYTDEEFDRGLQRIKERLFALLDRCVEHGTALRIGVNHGSLSDRIMSRYGDTPQGMVASAMEFLQLSRQYGFDQVVVSMKSSNTQVMVRATRMLCAAFKREGFSFPLHLGVTEAGEGEDGRIKSAVGIGALLNDGIGDTIRVSLTEQPESEIPVAQALVKYCSDRTDCFDESSYDYYAPYEYCRRPCFQVLGIGAQEPPMVISRQGTEADCSWDAIADKVMPLTISQIGSVQDKQLRDKIILFESISNNPSAEIRRFFMGLSAAGIQNPVVIKRHYRSADDALFSLHAAADLGGIFIDGMGDGLWISCDGVDEQRANRIAFAILQAARVRMTKTEYISCPGCGRTLYDLQGSLQQIKEATTELTALKIAVMGCIVNGPGEMADADYGYVGSGVGKVNLYKGKTLVRRNIAQEAAVEELVRLIKENGDWK